MSTTLVTERPFALIRLPQTSPGTRTYPASVETASPFLRDRFTVTLRGASFAARQDHFSAAATRDRVGFEVRPGFFPNDEWMSIVDVLAPDSVLAFSGRATSGVTDGRGTIDAPFTGSIIYCPATPAMPFYQCPVDPVRCAVGALTLTRE
jgi:hypothetical protein